MTKLEVQEKDGKIYAPLKDKWLVAKPEEKVRIQPRPNVTRTKSK